MRRTLPLANFPLLLTGLLLGCSSDIDDLFGGTGPGTGGNEVGGAGSAAGGSSNTGGQGGGGSSSVGGAPVGGSSAGGNSAGGNATGGASPNCGDGVADGNEDCDGGDLAGASCQDFGFSNEDGLACSAQCTFDASNCAPVCDGQQVEPGEACDGDDLNGVTCMDFGFVNPDGATCNNCSAIDAEGCQATCGNGNMEPGEACDGAVGMLFSCTDFGFTNPTNGAPLCTNCVPDPANCVAVCGNMDLEPSEGCDDGNTNPNDGCSASCQLEQDSCDLATPITQGFGTTQITGTTLSSAADLTTTSDDCGVSASAKNKVYAVTVTQGGFLTAWIERAGTNFDTVLYARTTCDSDASEILCSDSSLIEQNNFVGGGEVVSFPVADGTTVYLVVDGSFSNEEGDFALNVDLSTGQNCFDPIPLPIFAGTTQKVLGFTNGQTSTAAGGCGGSFTDDVVYELRRRTPTITNMEVNLPSGQTSYDSLLHVRTQCGSSNTEVGCSDVGGNGGEQLNLIFNMNDTRFMWVDGDQQASGSYALTITPSP